MQANQTFLVSYKRFFHLFLGLEHFYNGTDEWKTNTNSRLGKNKGLNEAYTYISSKMMRGKSSKQIKIRTKNRKDPCRKNGPKESNAIKYYFEHSAAPRIAMTELRNYNPSQTVAPKNADSQYLPELWREILRLPLKPLQEREPKRLKFSSSK